MTNDEFEGNAPNSSFIIHHSLFIIKQTLSAKSPPAAGHGLS